MTSLERKNSPVENIQAAWKILANGATVAANTLVEISRDGESEAARNQASMAILDRVGISAKPEVTVRVVPSEYSGEGLAEGGMTQGEIVRKRLLELAAATAAEAERQQQEESEIFEAVIVEEG